MVRPFSRARTPRGCLIRGCLASVAVALAFGGWFLVELTAPGRHAKASRAALAPGQGVGEIVAAARGGFRCTISYAEAPPREPPRVRVIDTWSGRGFQVFDERGASLGERMDRDALRRFLSLRADELASARRVDLAFRAAAVPRRVSFAVTLDAQGRLSAISPSRAWD